SRLRRLAFHLFLGLQKSRQGQAEQSKAAHLKHVSARKPHPVEPIASEGMALRFHTGLSLANLTKKELQRIGNFRFTLTAAGCCCGHNRGEKFLGSIPKRASEIVCPIVKVAFVQSADKLGNSNRIIQPAE